MYELVQLRKNVHISPTPGCAGAVSNKYDYDTCKYELYATSE